ncbi:MAG: helix-turn-helix domain-containing protein [Polyangiales bacterium]
MFGELLRQHRQARRLSQMQLAMEAEVSTRHLSFIETGRAKPSREMVLILGSVLDVPLRERNVMLEAAGFAAVYRESPLEGPSMAEMRRAVELILKRHEPYGAVALDRHWNIVLANEGYVRVHHMMFGPDALKPYVPAPPHMNVIRDFFRPDGMRRHVANWTEVAKAMVPRIVREASSSNDETIRALAKEVLAQPGVPSMRSVGAGPVPILIPLEIRMGDVTLRLFTTIATIGTAQDVTLSELRIESFHPADEETERNVRAMFGPQPA